MWLPVSWVRSLHRVHGVHFMSEKINLHFLYITAKMFIFFNMKWTPCTQEATCDLTLFADNERKTKLNISDKKA